MRLIVRFVLVVVLSIGYASARAQSAAITYWACWNDGDASVYCLLQSALPAEEHAVATAAAPGGRPLPAIVQAIRDDPASLEDRPIVIPLHTVPYDMGFVRQLTQSVMCGHKPACKVAFGRSYAEATGRLLASR